MTCVKCGNSRSHNHDCGFCRDHLCATCCDGELERVMAEAEVADAALEELLKTAPAHIRKGLEQGGTEVPF